MRGESAYCSREHRRFIPTLSLGYTLGAPSTLKAVKEGKRLFKQKARKNHYASVSLATGVSALDLGTVSFAADVSTRLMIIRRITRHKDRTTGKWRVKTYC